MRRLVLFSVAVLVLAAAPLNRGLVEDGTNTTVTAGATDGGQLLVLGLSTGETVRLRPATCTGGVCTRVAPDGGNEGLSMEDLQSWRAYTCAPGSSVIMSSNEVKLELWMRGGLRDGGWGPMPAKHLTATLTESAPCVHFPVQVNDMAAANLRFVYRPVNVVVSADAGGSLVTVIEACTMGRKGGCAP